MLLNIKQALNQVADLFLVLFNRFLLQSLSSISGLSLCPNALSSSRFEVSNQRIHSEISTAKIKFSRIFSGILIFTEFVSEVHQRYLYLQMVVRSEAFFKYTLCFIPPTIMWIKHNYSFVK